MQEVTDAVLRAKRRQSWRVARRNGLVDTMRRTAYNSLLRARASDPLQAAMAPLQTLDEVAAAATGWRQAHWLRLKERYQVRKL